MFGELTKSIKLLGKLLEKNLDDDVKRHEQVIRRTRELKKIVRGAREGNQQTAEAVQDAELSKASRRSNPFAGDSLILAGISSAPKN